MRSMATYMGEESSVQRPSSISIGPRRNGLKRAASETRRQKLSRAARAPSAPPSAWPSTSTAAFIAPADVPEMPSIPSHGSSSRRSNTPQVKAPWEPPPCNAKSTNMGARLKDLVSAAVFVMLVHNLGNLIATRAQRRKYAMSCDVPLVIPRHRTNAVEVWRHVLLFRIVSFGNVRNRFNWEELQ